MPNNVTPFPDSNSEWRKALGKIFVYHEFDTNNDTLKEVWKESLSAYTAEEILSAWQEWLMTDHALRAKPKPHFLIKIILFKRKSHQEDRTYYANESPQLSPPGTDWRDDLLRENLKKMHHNNPNLMQDIAACKTSTEKRVLCASALENPKTMEMTMQQFEKTQESKPVKTEGPKKLANVLQNVKTNSESWECYAEV